MYIVPPSAFYVCVVHYSEHNSPVHVNSLQANSNGLKGEYFAGAQTAAGSAASYYTVNGENINFEWRLSSPASGIPEDDFSVRWTGYLEAKYTEDVTLSGSAGLGSYDGSSSIYGNGDVSVIGGTSTTGQEGRIFGKLYYTGDLNGGYGITIADQT